MRIVYFASAFLFALSTLAVVQVSPQPVPRRAARNWSWQSLLNRHFFAFAASVCLTFIAMYVSFPLASNFLKELGGWRIARIGTLGSFQALGAALLNPLLGHLGDGAGWNTGSAANRSCQTQGKPRQLPVVEARGLVVGQTLVWGSALILLLARTFPTLALAYVLRGAYQGCRSLTQAQANVLASEADRGLVLGATETVIATAQIVAPYAAGWLYASGPTYPFVAPLALIRVTLVLGLVKSR